MCLKLCEKALGCLQICVVSCSNFVDQIRGRSWTEFFCPLRLMIAKKTLVGSVKTCSTCPACNRLKENSD